MCSRVLPRPVSDGRNDDEDHEDHDLTISIGRHTTITSGHQHKRHASLASAHRDSIQGKHHRRPPTGSYTKKGIKRRDDKRRSSVSSRTQLYNAFVTASSQVDDRIDSRDPFHDNDHQRNHFANIEEDSYGRFIQERRDGTKYTTRSVKGLKQSKLQHKHRRQTSSSTRGSFASRSRGRSASSEREGTSTLKKSVSFVDGGKGDAVTEVRDNDTYTDQEKEACFYTDRDFRRFRAEHYLGVVYVDREEDDSPKAAAQDLLHVVGDMWNSFLDMTFSSIHG